MVEVLKGTKFIWTPQVQRSLEDLKGKLTLASVLALPCVDKVFKVECVASVVGIVVVLIQEGRPLAYFSEKLSELGGCIQLMTKSSLPSSKHLSIGLIT